MYRVCVAILQITKDKEFADVVRDIVEYVNRDLSHKVMTFKFELLDGILTFS